MCMAWETELSLLEKAQAFLRCLRERRPAPSTLIDAWERFYERYSGVIRRFVERRGVFGVDADDCVQDVWIYVVRKLKDFQPPRNRLGIHAWLYRISVNVATSWYRARKRTTTPLRDAVEQQEAADEKTEGEALAEQQQRSLLVRECIGALRENDTEVNCRVVEMRFLEQRSVSDVAVALGLTCKQVWYRQHRVLARIRNWASSGLQATYETSVAGG